MSPGWWLLLGAGVYVFGHLVLYLAVLRQLQVFRRERTIFLYHLGAFAALLLGTGLACVATPAPAMITAGVGALALHAIYSMSFLELWSLSQISYSIAILEAVGTTPGLSLAAVTGRFADTGDVKKTYRLSNLQRLGLIVIQDGRGVLTPCGRVVAAALSALRWIANFERTG